MSPSLNPRLRLRPKKDVVVQRLGEEAVVLNLTTERYLGFDPVGARMWEVLMTAPSIDRARSQLLLEYDVDAVRLDADLADFIGKLMEHGLASLIAERASMEEAEPGEADAGGR